MKFRVAGDRTQVMGILNVTPDSFYAAAAHGTVDDAVAYALSMFSDGADIIDVGGESTRPGSEAVSVDEEISRVVPVIEAVTKKSSMPLSIDSYKTAVVSAALGVGASVINDVYSLRSPGMIELAAEHDVPVVVMHMQGTPKTMQEKPSYVDVVGEIKDFFRERVEAALAGGIKKENIILDPGIGFGKALEHNLDIIRRLPEFSELGFPILVGASRKSMIGEILGAPAQGRLSGSLAVAALSIAGGASIIRAHDVGETVDVARVADAVLSKGPRQEPGA